MPLRDASEPSPWVNARPGRRHFGKQARCPRRQHSLSTCSLVPTLPVGGVRATEPGRPTTRRWTHLEWLGCFLTLLGARFTSSEKPIFSTTTILTPCAARPARRLHRTQRLASSSVQRFDPERIGNRRGGSTQHLVQHIKAVWALPNPVALCEPFLISEPSV